MAKKDSRSPDRRHKDRRRKALRAFGVTLWEPPPTGPEGEERRDSQRRTGKDRRKPRA